MTRKVGLFLLCLCVFILVFAVTAFSAENVIVVSSSHPDQSKWYKDSSPIMSWSFPSSTQGYSYMLDNNAATVPDDISEGTRTLWTPASALDDGVYYFHIKAMISDDQWSETTHFRINIDTTPPQIISVEIDNSMLTCYSAYAGVSVDVTDGGSGPSKLEIANELNFSDSQVMDYHYYTPWTLKYIDSNGDGKNDSGTRFVYVTAGDAAGNFSVMGSDYISFTNLCGS